MFVIRERLYAHSVLWIQTYIGFGLWEEHTISCDDSRVQGVDWLCIYGAGIDVRYNASKEVKLI
jgi:hypothetical protein